MTLQSEAAPTWIGTPLSTLQVAAALFIGTVGVTIAGVQPVLYGALLEHQRISLAQVGHAASIELITLGVGVALGNWLFKRGRVPTIAIAMAVLLAAMNFLTLSARGDWAVLVRGFAGVPGGMMVWIAVAAIIRSPRPTFLAAVSLLAQALVQCLIATAVAMTLPGVIGGIPWAIILLAGLAAAAAPILPRAFDPLPKDETASGLPPARGWAVLAAALLLQACIVGAWVYMEPLGREAGLSAAQIAFAVPASLAAQIVGGILAILLANRLSWFPALVGASGILVVSLFVMAGHPPPMWFLALQILFGLLWTFSSPYLTPFAIDNDATRRTAAFVPSAMLIGSGAGPFAASMLASEEDAARVLELCATLALAAMVLIAALHFVRHRQVAKSFS